MSPARTKFTKRVRGSKTICELRLERPATKSFRCWGRKPSGPPADPAGKDQMADRTCEEDTSWGVGLGSGGVEPAERGWRGGCFSLSLLRVEASTGAKDSSELTIFTAPRKFPSSSFAATQAAKDLKGSLEDTNVNSWVVGLKELLQYCFPP